MALEVARYRETLEAAPSTQAIKQLLAEAEAIRAAELTRSLLRLGVLSPEQQNAVEALTRSLTAKLLHPQIAALRALREPGER